MKLQVLPGGKFNLLLDGQTFSGQSASLGGDRTSIYRGRLRRDGEAATFELVRDHKNESVRFKSSFYSSNVALRGDMIKAGAGIEFIMVHAGTMIMDNSLAPERRVGDDIVERKVRVENDFYLGVSEVTQRQWEQVMKTRPWTKAVAYFRVGPDYPALNIRWVDAVEFCERLSKSTGRVYRLPTEIEWEYAARAGARVPYCFGKDRSHIDRYAWTNSNTFGIGEAYAHKVRTLRPNPWGFYDMYGNVWEWCQDSGKQHPARDGGDAGEVSAGMKVLKGGCFINVPGFTKEGAFAGRYFLRSRGLAPKADSVLAPGRGFRVVLEPESAATQPMH